MLPPNPGLTSLVGTFIPLLYRSTFLPPLWEQQSAKTSPPQSCFPVPLPLLYSPWGTHSAAKGKKEGKSNPTSHCHLAIKHFSLIHQLIKQKDLTTGGRNTAKRQNNNKAKKSNPPMLSLPQPQEQEGSSFWGIWSGLVFSFNVLKQDVTL